MKTFLPQKDPLKSYKSSSKSLDLLSEIASQLPKLLLTGRVKKTFNSIGPNALFTPKRKL